MPLDREQIKKAINNMENEEIPRSPIVDNNSDNPFKQMAKSFSGNKSISLKDYDKYAKYNVYLNSVDDQETLDKERAKNQSNWEKVGRSFAQILDNEIILGTLKAPGDIVGAIQAAVQENPKFTNEYSKFFEELQDKNKERLEIYRQNPNKPFDIGDFSWWADNFVNVGSTVSLMLPALGTSALINKIGKLANLSVKTSKLIGKIPNAASKTGKLIAHPNIVAKELGNFANSSISAITSRTIENYQEARETYKQSYDETLNTLNGFTDEDKTKFLENNPRFINSTNEEIANILASEGAEKTMRNDYAMLLMDLLQYRALSSVLNKSLKSATGAKARIKARNEILKLNGVTDAAKLESENAWAVTKEYLKYGIKHPLDGLKSVPWSEAIEEGFQGIQSEKGKEYAKLILDPSITARSLDSYLSDGSIWEQAFWGVLGGLAFNVTGKGFDYAKNKIREKNAIEKLTDSEAAKYLTKGHIQEKEITSRVDRLKKFIEIIHSIRDGFIPEGYGNRYEKDENGEIKYDAEGSPILHKLNEAEQEIAINTALSDFMTDFTLDAVDAGTYDTLKDFINDSGFKEFLQKAGVSQSSIDIYTDANLQELMENIYDNYLNSINVVYTNTQTPDDFTLRATARHVTRREISIQNIKNRLKQIDDTLSKSKDYNGIKDAEQFLERARLTALNEELTRYDLEELRLETAYNNKEISKSAYKQSLKDISRLRQDRLSLLQNSKNTLELSEKLNNQVNDLLNTLNQPNISEDTYSSEVLKVVRDLQISVQKELLADETYVEPALSDATKKLIEDKIYNEVALSSQEGLIPYTKEEYINLYKEIEIGIDKLSEYKFNEAFETILKYLKDSEDVDTAWNSLMEGNVNNEKIENALDVLKLGHSSTREVFNMFKALRDGIKEEKEKELKDENEPVIDGEKQTGEAAEKLADDIKNKSNNNDPSTGETPITKDEINAETETLTEQELAEITLGAGIILDEERKNIGEDTSGIQPYGTMDATAIEDMRKSGKYINENSARIYSAVKAINTADDTDDTYKKLKNEIIEYLINKQVSPDRVTRVAIETIREALNKVKRKADDISKIQRLLDTLNNRLNILNDNELYSMTTDEQAFYDIIEETFKEYISSKNISKNKDGKYHINLNKFFEFIIREQSIPINKARNIFINMKNYIELNNSDTYIINKKEIDKYLNNVGQFFIDLEQERKLNTLVDSYLHISKTHRLSTEEVRDLIRKHLNDKRKHPITVSNNETTLSIKIDGKEIGYLLVPNVKNEKEDNTEISVNRSNGLNEYLKIENGNIISNFDDLFERLIDAQTNDNNDDKDAKELLKQLSKRVPDASILELDIIKDLGLTINAGTETDKALILSNYINNILFHDIKTPEDAKDKLAYSFSYESWKKRMFDNYIHTHDIAEKLTNGKKVRVKFNSYRIQRPNITDSEQSISTLKLLTPKDNPLIGIGENGRVFSEDGREFKDAQSFDAGTMGFLLHTANGFPIIAPFSSANKFNGRMKNLIKQEVIQTIKEWVEDDTITFNELKERFENLFGYFSKKGQLNPLTYGVGIITTPSGITLYDMKHKQYTGEYKPIVSIFNKKYQYTDDGKLDKTKPTQDTKAITIFTKDGKSKYVVLNELEERVPDDVINEEKAKLAANKILDNLTYNHSFFALLNVNNKDAGSNKYLSKINGKIVLNFHYDEQGAKTNTQFSYNTFGEFLMDNDAFNTRVKQLANEKRYTITDTRTEDNGMYIQIFEGTDREYSDMSDEGVDIEKGIAEITKASDKSPVKGIDVLSAFGISNDIISALSTTIKSDDGTNISLIPNKIYYDSKETEGDGKYISRSKKVYLTKGALDKLRTSSDAGVTLVRLLVHEQLHNNIHELNAIARNSVYSDLHDTYKQFIDYINNPANINKKGVASMKNWIETNEFVYDPDNNVYEIKGKKLSKNAFAEEWLIESLTRTKLSEFLDSVDYNGEIKEEKESLFQRIIKAILKIFGINFDNINKNSILAKQYSLFGDKFDTEVDVRETINLDDGTSKTIIEVPEHKPLFDDNGNFVEKQEPLITENDLEFNPEDDFDTFLSSTSDIEDEHKSGLEKQLDLFDSNGEINPAAILNVGNMNDFINQFSNEIKPSLATLLDNNNIKYICR